MKATISLEGLLALIHGLSLSASNKRWLGEKLIEEARKETQSAHITASSFYGVWKDEDFPEDAAGTRAVDACRWERRGMGG